MRPKPSINIKNSIDNGSIDFSERGVWGNGGEVQSLNRWMDNQEVCQQLNISPRTLQTLRDNGTLAYSQINHKVFYRPEDVLRIVKPVERKLADKAVWLLLYH